MAYVTDTMRPSDWKTVRRIYLEGIATGHSTFQPDAPDWDGWDAGHRSSPRIVARQGDEIVGWAALSTVSSRAVHAGVAEVSLYVAQSHRGRGVGSIVLDALVAASEAEGIWTLQGSIFPENRASLALFAKHGFATVGVRQRLGLMSYGELAGHWRDVVLVERRSAIVGIDGSANKPAR